MSFDRDFWDEYGYIHIKGAVPREQLAAVVRDMETFTGKQLADQGQWYREPLGGGGMINMANTQAEWDNRSSPRVYDAFRGIWERDDLWVTINRVNFNPPVGPDWDHAGFIHWDLDPSLRPIEFRVQGVLYLEDTAEDMGGFQCVPGSHRKLQEWHDTHPEDEVATEVECMKGLEVKKIAGEAGDLIIWQASLLHGNGKNTSSSPRLAQYICMTPAGTARAGHGLIRGDDELGNAKVETWRLLGYETGLAGALGVPEAFVERWITRMVFDGNAARDVAPAPGLGSRLTAKDGERLLDLVERASPWSDPDLQEALEARRKFGTTASYWPVALMAARIATIVERAFGEPVANPVPRLNALGRRLLGVTPW